MDVEFVKISTADLRAPSPAAATGPPVPQSPRSFPYDQIHRDARSDIAPDREPERSVAIRSLSPGTDNPKRITCTGQQALTVFFAKHEFSPTTAKQFGQKRRENHSIRLTIRRSVTETGKDGGCL